ncbi:Longin-like domain-containing protein [Coniochaeta sp. 2T2.1]|nr:Longin-like domain-containing protein [Coniochaeta sp. 2T2.1]
MKLFYIGIIRNDTKPAHELVAEKEMSSYSRFTRSSVGEFLSLFAKTVGERTNAGQRQDVEEQDYTFHAYGRSEGVCGIIISDHAYPALVAHQLLSKVVDEFLSSHPKSQWATGSPTLSMPELKDYIVKYQDPHQADSIMKIQRELDETKIVLHKTIESVLQRGEKIDDLVAKSDGLSAQSKMFYQQAKKQNSCCKFCCHATLFWLLRNPEFVTRGDMLTSSFRYRCCNVELGVWWCFLVGFRRLFLVFRSAL